MRLVPVMLAAVLLSACGTTREAGSPPTSSGADPVLKVPTQTELAPTELRPPPIVLTSRNGDQRAIQGSFCLNYVDPDSGAGQGSCGDTGPIQPDEVTGVAPGDQVTFVFVGAKVVRPSGCHSEDEQECIGSVSVKPLGCEGREVESVPLALGPETRWTVDLKPGAYQLYVFAYFESASGATGDVSGTLGLTVAGPKKFDVLGVSPVKPSMQACEFDATSE
ncbi:MAG TPA: hypothetical protein VH281_00110 [Gaiellaceae bacterium]